MITFTRKLNIKDPFETNIFFRKLWTALDELEISKGRKGNGWQFMPNELQNGEISLGFCNAAGEVIVRTDDNGGVDAITFKCLETDKTSINNCVGKALDKNNKPRDFCCVYRCKSSDRDKIVNSSYENVFVFSPKDGMINICINVKAFGTKDAKHVLLNMLPYVTALIFAYYHRCVTLYKINLRADKLIRKNCSAGELVQKEWVDDAEISKDIDGKYLVKIQFLKALNYLESIVWDRKNAIYPILNSARSIHLADDELDVLIHRKLKVATDYSLLDGYVNGMIMSVLEGLATREAKPQKCPGCGQPVYSISKTVKEYVTDNLGDYLGSYVNNLYNKRSQLFHENRINLYEYMGTSWPLLMTLKSDKTDEVVKNDSFKIRRTFINYSNVGSFINFIDYVSYLIRKALADFFEQTTN